MTKQEIREKQGELVRLLVQLIILESQDDPAAPDGLTYWKGILETPSTKYLITVQHVEGQKIPLREKVEKI